MRTMIIYLLSMTFAVLGCGDDDGSNADASASSPDAEVAGIDATSGRIDATVGARPHPQYPALDLDTLPGNGGGAIGPYVAPTAPSTTRSVAVSTTGTQARTDLMAACAIAGTQVSVPDSAGVIGVVNLGNVTDCDLTLGASVVITTLVIGSLPGPTHAPSQRVRIRGGQVGSMLVIGGSRDLIFDGVVFNNGVVPPGSRTGTAIYMPTGQSDTEVVERMVVVSSIIRMVGVDAGGGDVDGTPYLGVNARNIMFANNNIVTAGNRNSWGFRIGGGDNVLLVDNTVRVSFHKLVRMNTNPVDYVYIKGGVWMREATLTAGGSSFNDSFQQLSGSTTDNVYVHDPVVYLLSASPVGFGMTYGAVQSGKSWEARRIQWHATNTDVISDSRLQTMQNGCPSGASCDYGIGSHSYQYDAGLSLPANPWRNLPGIPDDDPDDQPVRTALQP